MNKLPSVKNYSLVGGAAVDLSNGLGSTLDPTQIGPQTGLAERSNSLLPQFAEKAIVVNCISNNAFSLSSSIKGGDVSEKLPFIEPCVRGLNNGGKNNCWINSILQLIFHSEPLRKAILGVPEYEALRVLCKEYFRIEENVPNTQEIRLMLCMEHPGAQIGQGPTMEDAVEALNLMLGRVPISLSRELFPTCCEIKQYTPTGRTKPVGSSVENSKLNIGLCTLRHCPPDPHLFLEIPSVCDEFGKVDLSRANFEEMLSHAFENSNVSKDDPGWFLGEDPEMLYEYLPVGSRIVYEKMPSLLVVTLRRFKYDVETRERTQKSSLFGLRQSPGVEIPTSGSYVSKYGPTCGDRAAGAFTQPKQRNLLSTLPRASIKDRTPVQVPRVLELPVSSVPNAEDRRLVLRSFLVHSGIHYISYINDKGQWKRCDDSEVETVDLDEVDNALCHSYSHCYEMGDADDIAPMKVQTAHPSWAQVAIALELACLLEMQRGNQESWLKLFSKLDRKWQYRSMFWVWKAANGPIKDEFGRITIVKSALHLLDKVGTGPGAKRAIDHVIDEMLEAPRSMTKSPFFPSENLVPKVREVIDRNIAIYLNYSWDYLRQRYFPSQTWISDSELESAARESLKKKNFSVLDYKIIEHPDLPGWILKSNGHIGISGRLKVLKEAAAQENLSFCFPEIHRIDSGVETDNLEERYILAQQKLPLLNCEEVIFQIQKISCDKQRLYAEHLCRLILKTGYSAHFGNMTLVNEELYLLDEDPVGMSSDVCLSFEECVIAQLQKVRDMAGEQLPIFRIAAENALVEVQEKSLDMPEQRHAFHQLIASLADSQGSAQERVKHFLSLDLKLQHFLAFVVGEALKSYEGEGYGWKRILEQPEILGGLSNSTGVNILRQIDTRFQLQEGIEILCGLKATLTRKDPCEKSFRELSCQLVGIVDGKEVFAPLKKALTQILEGIEERMKGASEDVKLSEFCHRLLYVKNQESNICLLDRLIGMLHVVKRDYSLHAMRWRMERAHSPIFGSVILDPTPVKSVSKEQVLAERFPNLLAAKKLRVLMVAYECAVYGLKFGGLGEAVYGEAKGLADKGHEVTILLPKFDQLAGGVASRQQLIEEVFHPYLGKIKKDRVLGYEDQGMHLRYLEDTQSDESDLDHYSIPGPKQIYEDGILADPDEKWFGLKRRMAYFSNAAAEFVVGHKDQLDIVVLHDWHSAYAINRIASRYFDAWSCGKMPASIFVIHNNSYGCQGIYDGKAAQILPMFGDWRPGINVMLDAMAVADEVVIVSPSFALEAQGSHLGAGIESWMRRVAHQGKLSGIPNGSNPDIWDPSENKILMNWVDPITKEHIPLVYSSADDNLSHKKALIKEQLQKAIEIYYPDAVTKYRLNVRDCDLILYVGRYDSSQKGIEKMIHIMRAAHVKGAAFVTLGIGEDLLASELLDRLEIEAGELGNAWITRGKEDGFSIKMQLGDEEKKIPGLGPLFRAAAIYCVAPSNFEPCGLVQFEAWLFGALVIATATGGLADTIYSDPCSSEFNGFTFERLGHWDSSEQNDLIYQTTLSAIDYFRSLDESQKQILMQKVMKEAKLSSWTSSSKSLTPIEQYERVFSAAIQNAKISRGTRPIDLIGLDEPRAVSRDHYFGKGRREKLYETFGAHIAENGVRFRVMVPGATSVNLVVLDALYPMNFLGDGSWEIFLNGAGKGTVYEYEITDAKGRIVRKADPFAFASEVRPKHRSVVADYEQFCFSDEAWMSARAKRADQEQPLNIYEVHMASWRQNSDGTLKNYRELAHELGAYCKEMNYTHVELLGLLEHPSDSSWGYQVSGYFAPTSRHGTMEDFQYLVNHLHTQEIGLIIDFVPYHFAPNEWGLREFGGERFFESGDPHNGESPGWGTRVFDLEREDVRNFLLSSAHFFLVNHIDGFRIDAVSLLVSLQWYTGNRAWTPNKEGTHWNLGGIEFMRSLTTMAHTQFPGTLMHAENSRGLQMSKIDTDPVEKDGLGFDGRWDMHWMHGALSLLGANVELRSWEFDQFIATFGFDWQLKHISSVSHDEVVHCKGSLYERAKGSPEEKLAQVRLHQSMQILYPADGVLSFMGNEFAQSHEWDYEKELSWQHLTNPGHLGVWEMSRAINSLYLKSPPLWSSGYALSRFEWVSIHHKNYTLSYNRWDAEGKRLMIVHNFSRKAFKKYRFYFDYPESSKHLKKMKVVFNTDEKRFGGTGEFDEIKKAEILRSEEGAPQGFKMGLPAHSTIVFDCKMLSNSLLKV